MLLEASTAIFGFYHLYTVNNWRQVLGEQILRWSESGLTGATTRIFASVVGPLADEGAAVLSALCGERLEVVHQSADGSSRERPILEYARRFCEEREPLARACWYMHAKGVSDQHCENPNVSDWRRLLDHFAVDRWRDCAAALEDHDACGVNWHREPAPHFSGNYWWARPDYLRRLPLRVGPANFDQERWIGLSQPHVRCLHESGVDHYRQPYSTWPPRSVAAISGTPGR
jgi:hypothetical protein